MKVTLVRSGGISGIPLSREIDLRDLPSALVTKVMHMIEKKGSYTILRKRTPNGAADHYTYKISFKDGKNQRVIECDQYDLEGDLKLLIKYLENSSRD